MAVPNAIFLVHLLQDVHVLRPLIFMASRDFGFRTELLVSDRFRARDTSGLWLDEIQSISAQSGAEVTFFSDDWQARSRLTGRGLIFAASESHIRNHAVAHDIFRHAPGTYLKVTLQHGFECVGFRHGADHRRFYGDTASFAADILCAWSGPERLTALAHSQAPKILVTGPTSVLQTARGEVNEHSRTGLICENLHSVRFEAAEKLQEEFLQTFRKFAGAMHRHGHRLHLRPHPGGQYLVRASATLPRTVELENAPLYRVDLRQFSYGISPPSSMLIDLLLADIPTAVWRDRRGRIDVENYEGLITVSSAGELVEFAQDAVRDPGGMVLRQRQWLDQQGMPRDPADVYGRFAQLFETAERMEIRRPGSRPERERVLLLGEDGGRSHPGLLKALEALAANGEVTNRVISIRELQGLESAAGEEPECASSSVEKALEALGGSVIIIYGQEVSAHQQVLEWAHLQQVPVIYLPNGPNVGSGQSGPTWPGSGGDEATSALLRGADVIYAPTQDQEARLQRAFPQLETITAPAEQQVGDEQEAATERLRKDLLRIIALGHARAEFRASHRLKEVQDCQSQ